MRPKCRDRQRRRTRIKSPSPPTRVPHRRTAMRGDTHFMDTASVSSLRLIEQRPFVLFWLSRLCATTGTQMLALLIGWQIYALTGSAFDLGLVGLIQFVPAVVLTLLIGHAADRYDRRAIVRIAQAVYAAAALMITAALVAGAVTR